jgi:FHA domain
MGRTTIALDLIQAIKLGKADKAEVLRQLSRASAGAEALRHGPPAATVTFHKLRDQPRPRDLRASLARGTAIHAAGDYEVSATASLYELTDAARVDVIRFGRHPDQDIQLLDPTVSREHGLIIYAGELPLFCDYGTMIGGAHAGSTNGTFIDGEILIRDSMIRWLPTQVLMLGKLIGGHHATKITYQLHPNGGDVGN